MSNFVNNTYIRSIASVVLMTVVAFLPYIVSAQGSDNVGVTLQVGADTTNPTTPTNLVATAVSQSQIDLSWDTASDNVGVAGYTVYRDGAQIATTSATSYSDTGLSANTTYAYNVSAYDSAGNESAQSATSTATTDATSTPPQDNEQNTGGNDGENQTSDNLAPELEIENVSVEEARESAIITFRTNRDATAIVTVTHPVTLEQVQLTRDIERDRHYFSVNSLESGQEYDFLITAETAGSEAQFEGSFATLSEAPVFVPNVANFSAVGGTDRIMLDWQNPDSSQFDYVRIVRSPRFFPTDPTEGEVVYEGRGERTIDTDVEPGEQYFYTAFSVSPDREYSSGVLTTARLVTDDLPEDDRFTEDGADDVIDQLPSAEGEYPLLQSLSFLDFGVFQDGSSVLRPDEGYAQLQPQKNFQISLPADKVPSNLKTIVATLRHPDGTKSFSFLLRLNEAQTHYEAEVGGLLESGQYDVSITVLDYRIRKAVKVQGALVVETLREQAQSPSFVGQLARSSGIDTLIGLLFTLGIGAFMLWLMLVATRRKEEEEAHRGAHA